MKNETTSIVESNYRILYGKLFAALFRQFGAKYVSEIEDAIQNSFYKSLKSWKPQHVPENKENWLFIVARNDVLNQIQKENRFQSSAPFWADEDPEIPNEDLRLKTILFLTKSKKVSSKTKVMFVLKNIFGLHIKEISESLLLSQDAIYKSINRAKNDFRESARDANFELTFEETTETEVALAEEILYAVFNIGFDSFSDKIKSTINEDICLEALALGKLLSTKFQTVRTKNLLALFCFHLARIPAKVQNDKFISFFEQDKSLWNEDFVKLGFHYLEKPERLNKYYLEALIASKHMMTPKPSVEHWNEVSKLYQLLLTLANSPITKLNLCYCLSKAQRTEEAIELLEMVENELPHEHIYLSLVKANIVENKKSKASDKIIIDVLKNIHQKIRREFILENMASEI